MADIIKVPKFSAKNGFSTTSKRSMLMSKIKSKDSKAEIMLRKALWHKGLRYRKNVKGLPGTPDILISSGKLVIFIDGEFWHGYNWEVRKHDLKSNKEFWIAKIERNMQKDLSDNLALENMGYHVLRFGEKEVKHSLDRCVKIVLFYIESAKMTS